MRNIGVFIDVSNLYYCIKSKYNSKLNYKGVVNYLKGIGEVQVAVAYGAQMDKQAQPFIDYLKSLDFFVKYKKPKEYKVNGVVVGHKADWDVQIAMDIVNMSPKLDLIVLGSSDSDLAPCVQWAVDKGIKVIVLGCGISRELIAVATNVVEIPESMVIK